MSPPIHRFDQQTLPLCRFPHRNLSRQQLFLVGTISPTCKDAGCEEGIGQAGVLFGLQFASPSLLISLALRMYNADASDSPIECPVEAIRPAL